MCETTINRLTVVGPAADLKAFDWTADLNVELGAKHADLLERSPTRHAWQFETSKPPLPQLKTLSARWPTLVFLLDYDREHKRNKGLAKARAGRLTNHRVIY